MSVRAVILVFVGLLIVAYTWPTALGTVANESSGNAMKNVSTAAMSLWDLIPLFAILSFLLGIIGAAISQVT